MSAHAPIGLATRKDEGFNTLTPYLVVHDANKALSFYKKVFGASEIMPAPIKHPKTGKVAHHEIRIGNSPVFITDEFPEWNTHGPKTVGGSPVQLHIYVNDVDDVFKTALAAGAKELIPVGDQFYGARGGRLEDPFGHVWIVETQKEKVSHGERQTRFESMLKKMGAA